MQDFLFQGCVIQNPGRLFFVCGCLDNVAYEFSPFRNTETIFLFSAVKCFLFQVIGETLLLLTPKQYRAYALLTLVCLSLGCTMGRALKQEQRILNYIRKH